MIWPQWAADGTPPTGTACVLCSLRACLKSSQLVSGSSPKTEISQYLFGFADGTRSWKGLDLLKNSEVNILSCGDEDGHTRSCLRVFLEVGEKQVSVRNTFFL